MAYVVVSSLIKVNEWCIMIVLDAVDMPLFGEREAYLSGHPMLKMWLDLERQVAYGLKRELDDFGITVVKELGEFRTASNSIAVTRFTTLAINEKRVMISGWWMLVEDRLTRRVRATSIEDARDISLLLKLFLP